MRKEKILAVQNIFGSLLFIGIMIGGCVAESEAILLISFGITVFGCIGAIICEIMIEKIDRRKG